MLKKLVLLACLFGFDGCTINATKPAALATTKSSNIPMNPLVQAVSLIEQNNYVDAKKLLDDFVDARPKEWAHRIEDAKQVHVYFWDREQLAECGVFEIIAARGKKMDPVLDASYSKAYYLLAFLALESRNNPYNNALINLDKGLALEPDQPTLQYEKANLYYRLKRPEKAVEEYTRLTQTNACLPNPQRARAYRGLGEALVALARYDDAEVALYQSLKLDPDNKKSITELDYIDKVRNLNLNN
jgi:tetratricopeptide (TPR) repeat protein